MSSVRKSREVIVMAKMDELARKREKKELENMGKSSKVKDEKMDSKKESTMKDFEKEAQVKSPLNFFREPFLSNCFLCKRGFKIVNDKMASCDHTFNITPKSTFVQLCYMEQGGFLLDDAKIAEVEKKYNVKVTPPEEPSYLKLQRAAAEAKAAADKKAADEATDAAIKAATPVAPS